MSGILLLVYMLAFGLGCMTLALAIVYRLANAKRWATYFIVCHASLLGCMMLLALQVLSQMFLSGVAYTVVSIIITSVFLADLAFLIVFIPYFTTWVIAHPWRNPYKGWFFSLAAIYLGLGIAPGGHGKDGIGPGDAFCVCFRHGLQSDSHVEEHQDD